jgi:deoxycytidine triphosphate deaminase
MAAPFNDPDFVDAFRRGPPQSETEAKAQYERTAFYDPFPEILPALLNSSDIYNYVSATGMVYPFEKNNLKSASYAIRIGDQAIYWDGIGALNQIHLEPNQPFRVPDNSIVFIKSKEYFRLPRYLAMRFDLKIMNVHRGILLGTGPVVDPGFEGHLLIPLHNLTTNVYSFLGDETFVWVEFTEISPNHRWDPSRFILHANRGLHDEYKPFPTEKKYMTEWDYLYQAHSGPIRSSIPNVMATTAQDARLAKEQAEAAKNYNQFLTIAVPIAVIVGVIAFLEWLVPQLMDFHTLTRQAVQFQSEARDLRQKDEARVEQLVRDIQGLRDQIAAAGSNRDREVANTLEKRITDLEVQLRLLQAKAIDEQRNQGEQKPK